MKNTKNSAKGFSVFSAIPEYFLINGVILVATIFLVIALLDIFLSPDP